MLDKERIRQDADPAIIAESLGIHVHHRHNRKMILCPAHNDHNIGSCYLTEHGFKCYACGRHGDVFEMVQLKLGVDFEEAKKYVADICGGVEYYEADNTSFRSQIGFISRKEQETIGIKDAPVYSITGFTYDWFEAKKAKEEGYLVDSDFDYDEGCFDGYIIKKMVCSSPLLELYRDDITTYRTLIDDFCNSKIRVLTNTFELIRHPELCSDDHLQKVFYQLRGMMSDNDLVSAFNQMLSEVKYIAKKHGSGQTKTNIADAQVVSVVANSIWEKEKRGAF